MTREINQSLADDIADIICEVWDDAWDSVQGCGNEYELTILASKERQFKNLLKSIEEYYPQLVRDCEINLTELKKRDKEIHKSERIEYLSRKEEVCGLDKSEMRELL